MQVLQILKRKSDKKVFTVTPETSIGDVVATLCARRIGAVVVSSDGKHVGGIVSERDIVRELSRRGPDCMSLAAHEVMTRTIQSCEMMDNTDAVLERMTEGHFRHMPVVENGEMIGLISIGDVVAKRLDELQMEKEALQGMIMGN